MTFSLVSRTLIGAHQDVKSGAVPMKRSSLSAAAAEKDKEEAHALRVPLSFHRSIQHRFLFHIVLIVCVFAHKISAFHVPPLNHRWRSLSLSLFPSSSLLLSRQSLRIVTSSPRPWILRASIQNGDDSTTSTANDFLNEIEASLMNQDFVSLVLRGPSKKSNNKDLLRGCIRQVQGRIIDLKGNEFLQLTIKYHGATDIAKNYALNRIRPGLEALLFSSSTTLHIEVASEWGTETLHPVGSALGIATGDLTTTSAVVSYSTQQRRLERRTVVPVMNSLSSTTLPHDRSKATVVPRQATFLQALGLTNERGEPKPTRSAKVKQCQKFVEIVSQLVERSLEGVTVIVSTDMGCGRGYLTFSWHYFLSERYGDTMTITSKGIDVRPKLVNEMNTIAQQVGMHGLVFEEGTIERSMSSEETRSVKDNPSKSLHIVMALHACDTATDDAIWSGLIQQADIIVVAPCCHKEVRMQLDASLTLNSTSHPLGSVLRHNIYRERMAEMVTDSMRALLLEIANYDTQVFEFVGGEHTAKNVMITAVKRRKKQSKMDTNVLRMKLKSLAVLHGVSNQRLAQWMQEEVGEVADIVRKTMVFARQMPPL